MTDKQIIIDGIDVTGCEYCSRYADTTIYHCDWIGECKEHPNCLYKQLKRKEQEYEELKKQLETKGKILTLIDEAKNEYSKENNKLKQTLAEIKEIAEHCIKQEICTACDNSEKCHIEDEEIPTYDVCKLILQKISEVTND